MVPLANDRLSTEEDSDNFRLTAAGDKDDTEDENVDTETEDEDIDVDDDDSDDDMEELVVAVTFSHNGLLVAVG